ncbi:hypothetical protein UFOVP27_31 [uncultured Caudovirales phage]|uniref:Uncharacterized protein n=1 Tax=uncultured Caudovirales phage TaxID=2100421 RepID=A0A6J5KIK6_9CAUD|nr:hypothetical protein UFOVP27_31 [uncultured Caudovirales phage]
MSAILALEGVLKTETGDPIPEGIKLFRILSEFYRIVISSDLDTKQTEHWLRSHMIVGYGEIYDSSLFFTGQDLRSRHLAVAKSKGKVELFIDADADYCAEALSMGIPTIMFASPTFVRLSRDVKPWEDLQVEVARQKEALLEAHLGSRVTRFE